MTKPSTHLHARKNRELYRDTVEQHNQLFCIWGRHLSFHLEHDTPNLNPRFSEHLKKCSLCQREMKAWKGQKQLLERAIPSVVPHQNAKELMRSECHQLLELVHKRIFSRQSANRPKWIPWGKAKLAALARDTFRALTSRELFQGAILAVVLSYLLSIVL